MLGTLVGAVCCTLYLAMLGCAPIVHTYRRHEFNTRRLDGSPWPTVNTRLQGADFVTFRECASSVDPRAESTSVHAFAWPSTKHC